MAAEIIKVECPNCGNIMEIPTNEFVDVSEDPALKGKIIEGEFFLNTCDECGDLVMVEYPVIYVDPDHALNVYMAPEHEDDLLDEMNSLDIPPVDVSDEAVFRVVPNGASLMEKILIAEKGRDDRVIELYKFLIWEQVQDEWDDLQPGDLLYMFDESGEFLVIWTSDNGNDEKLTIELDEELYDEIAENYLPMMEIPVGKYAEVDQAWIGERFERED